MVPKKMNSEVIDKKQLSENVWLIRLGFEEKIELKAGQYASLKVTPEGMRRSYSIAGIGETWVDLIVDVSPMGVGSQYVLSLKVGDGVELIGFLGSFVLESRSFEDENVLFVATGTGIAPFYPMVEEMLKKGYKGKVNLWWGMRHEEDLYWWEKLEEMKTKNDSFEYEIVLSKADEKWQGKKGHVGDLIEKAGFDWNKTSAYLCGGKEMILEVKQKLMEAGVPEEKIYYEKFY